MQAVFIKLLLFDEATDDDVAGAISDVKAGDLVYDAFEVQV